MPARHPMRTITEGAKAGRGTLARQWELLKVLPTHGAGKTAKELTENLISSGFKVSKRQVERDLLDLSAIFPLHCNDAGMPYGWRWADNASSDLPGLTVADALSLKLVEASLKPLLPPAIQAALLPRFLQAEKKLTALDESNANARWVHKVRAVSPGLNLQKTELNATLLATVQECLLIDEQVEARYCSGDGKETASLMLHPLALVTRGPATYLIATAFDYTDVRRYALHRFESATRTYQPSRRPADFDIDDYLKAGGMQFGDGKMIDLEARVSKGLAVVLAETPLTEYQILTRTNGFPLLKVSLPDSWQFRWWLLSQGDQIEVLGPKALRRETIASLRKALEQYGNE